MQIVDHQQALAQDALVHETAGKHGEHGNVNAAALEPWQEFASDHILLRRMDRRASPGTPHRSKDVGVGINHQGPIVQAGPVHGDQLAMPE
jgi:hypothetical protein